MRRMLLGQINRCFLRCGDSHHLVAGIAYDVRHVERDHRLVLDDQHTDRRDALQFAARLLEVALGRIYVDAEDMSGIAHREAFEDGEQQEVPFNDVSLVVMPRW